MSVWGDQPWLRLRGTKTNWARTTLNITQPGIAAGVLIGVLCFLGYAYWELFREPKASDLLVALSALFAAFNVLRAALTTYDEKGAAQ